MNIKEFKKHFSQSTDLDTLIEKRQSLVQQIIDLESELAHDGVHYTYSEIEAKMKGYTAIKAKHSYLDSLIESKRPSNLSPNFDEYITCSSPRSHIED